VEQTDQPGSSTGQAAESDIYDYFVSIEPALPFKTKRISHATGMASDPPGAAAERGRISTTALLINCHYVETGSRVSVLSSHEEDASWPV